MTPAPLAALLNDVSAAPGRPFVVPGRWPASRRRHSQPSRRTATRRSVYMRKVPHGSMRAPSQNAFLDAVRASEAFSSLRADSAASLWAVAQQLAFRASWDTMTTRPTWAVLVKETGRSWSTVARAIKRLRDAGLVGVVKTGRDGAHQPAKCDRGLNDAAVYVLCVPSTVSPVDEDDTLSGLWSGEGSHPSHARESDSSSVPLRGPQPGAPAAPGAPVEREADRGRPADRGEGQRRPDERLAQAIELRKRVPVLRSISPEHVRSIVREFALAGWSTGELVMAIDHRPDGTAWHHSGAIGVRNVGAWLGHRLEAWRDGGGTVRQSPGRLAQLAAAERLARARVEREAAAAWAAGEHPQSPALVAIRAHLAGLPRRTR